jgi:NAD(P)-dependent dehydrogenase (short-subunit alcohol dehydrogenase family)
MSEKILIIGKNSNIAKEFLEMVGPEYQILKPSKKQWNMENLNFSKEQNNLIKQSNRILLLQSVISDKKFINRKDIDIIKQIKVNLLSVIKICEIALKFNKNVKIIVIGSESGFKGSYDISYALTKTSIHKYVEEKRISYPDQQLLCIAPSTIVDTGITLRRHDQNNVKRSIQDNPKKRGILSKEIAKLIFSLFFEQSNYLNNIVIRFDGGKFSRMKT